MFDLSEQIEMTAPLLGQLSSHIRDCLMTRARRRRFERGQTICLQGEPAGALKIVVHGWVKLFRVSASGHEALLELLSDGGSFDEIAALRRQDSAAYAEAVTDCEILYLDIGGICSCHNAAEEITAAVLSATSSRLHHMMHQVEQLKVMTGVERLSTYLVDLVDSHDGALEVYLPFDKVVLAARLGMKPESLSRAFSKLRKLGVTSELRRVTVPDVEQLRDMVA
jgi:CRP-like cAMP-binding protein